MNELGYTHMFIDAFDALDHGREPMETLYDGYVVNAILDACYKSARSKKWEPIELTDWRGRDLEEHKTVGDKFLDEKYDLVKEEKMPDGRRKLILKDKETGKIIERIE